MAGRKTKKGAAPSIPQAPEGGFRVLKPFHHPAAADGTFGFGRFYWLEGAGHRQSILSNIRKKLRPVPGEAGEETAARVEVLLPSDAPEEYTELDFLVKRFEEKLPAEETTAYAQVTLRFPEARNAHHPYEVARAWVRSFFIDEPAKGVPAVLILHTPHLAGSDSPLHVHALVLPRQLRWFGWANVAADLANDKGHAQALESWIQFRREKL